MSLLQVFVIRGEPWTCQFKITRGLSKIVPGVTKNATASSSNSLICSVWQKLNLDL
jgi:hypothetical protein